jgi:hypothetical protein
MYLTAQVRPVGLNGVSLNQWVHQLDPTGQMSSQDLQHRMGKFTSIQGYDLAHGQFPDGIQIGFSPQDGAGVEHNLGRDGITVAPQGRLLDAHDANSLNVLIPIEADWGVSDQVCCVDYYNGDTITVQSPVDGRTLTLHVVGVYEEDGAATNFFGNILADNSVVRALSGGRPTYAYGLHLDALQGNAVCKRLQTAVPTAQCYSFTNLIATMKSYSSYTDLNAEGIWWVFSHPLIAVEIAAWLALLVAIFIVAAGEARAMLQSQG